MVVVVEVEAMWIVTLDKVQHHKTYSRLHHQESYRAATMGPDVRYINPSLPGPSLSLFTRHITAITSPHNPIPIRTQHKHNLLSALDTTLPEQQWATAAAPGNARRTRGRSPRSEWFLWGCRFRPVTPQHPTKEHG